MTRFLLAISFLTVLSLPTSASALEDERTWEQKHEEGLRALRLAIPVGTINVAYLSAASAAWLSGAHQGDTRGQRGGAYAIGAIAAAGAVANIAWILYAGQSLAEYKQRTGPAIGCRYVERACTQGSPGSIRRFAFPASSAARSSSRV